jgi:hypothetical protein
MAELIVNLPAVPVVGDDVTVGASRRLNPDEVGKVEELYRSGGRDEVLARAVVDGKFPAASVSSYREWWDGDAVGTRALVARLACVLPRGVEQVERDSLESARAALGLKAGGAR